MTFELWIAASLLSIGFLLFLALIELLKRRFSLSSELTRRVVHVGAGISALLDYLYLPGWLFLVLTLVGGALFAVSFRFKVITSVHNVVRKTYGELWLTAGIVGAYFISLVKPEVFIPALLIISLADSFAGLMSDLFRKPRKLWLGSFVFFLTSLTVLILTGNHPLWQSAVTALTLTLVERFSPRGSDNVAVPIAAAALLLL